MSEHAAGAKTERAHQAARRAGPWGCLLASVGLVLALVGTFLLEGSAGTALVSLGGSFFGVGLMFALWSALVRWLVPSRS